MSEPLDIKLIPIPYRTDTVTIISFKTHPYIGIEELCKNLDINHKQQLRRLKKYHATLRLKIFPMSVNKQVLAIPLENLSWFLLSLRPHKKNQQENLADYRDTLAWAMLYFWYRYMKNYTSPEEFAKHMKYNILAVKGVLSDMRPPSNQCPPARQASPVTAALVMEMRTLKNETNLSQGRIASKLGVSATTVSLCLRGLYPVQSLRGE